MPIYHTMTSIWWVSFVALGILAFYTNRADICYLTIFLFSGRSVLGSALLPAPKKELIKISLLFCWTKSCRLPTQQPFLILQRPPKFNRVLHNDLILPGTVALVGSVFIEACVGLSCGLGVFRRLEPVPDPRLRVFWQNNKKLWARCFELILFFYINVCVRCFPVWIVY